MRAEGPVPFGDTLQTQQPADEKEDGDQEHAKYSHTPNSQMDRREEFGSCSLLTPFSGHCAPEMAAGKDVAVIRNQTLEPGLNFHKSYRQDFRRQEKALRIGILRAPPALVLNDRSPEQDLSVN